MSNPVFGSQDERPLFEPNEKTQEKKMKLHPSEQGLSNIDYTEETERAMRTFDTGATRDSDDGKFDYEGFLSPLVLRRYAEYLHVHRTQADGQMRDSDNWQKGIPLTTYMKSMWRHFIDLWTLHRSTHRISQDMEEALCAVIFNASGYLHELLKEETVDQVADTYRPSAINEGETT